MNLCKRVMENPAEEASSASWGVTVSLYRLGCRSGSILLLISSADDAPGWTVSVPAVALPRTARAEGLNKGCRAATDTAGAVRSDAFQKTPGSLLKTSFVAIFRCLKFFNWSSSAWRKSGRAMRLRLGCTGWGLINLMSLCCKAQLRRKALDKSLFAKNNVALRCSSSPMSLACRYGTCHGCCG